MKSTMFWMLTAVLVPSALAAQDIVIDFSDHEERDGTGVDPLRATITVANDGHFFIAPTTLGGWVEVDETGALVKFEGRRWDGGAPGEYRNIGMVVPTAGDTLIVLDQGRIVWTTRDNKYLASRVLAGFTAQTAYLEDGRLTLGGTRRGLVLTLVDVGAPGELEIREHRFAERFEIDEETGNPTNLVSGLWFADSRDRVWVDSHEGFFDFRTNSLGSVDVTGHSGVLIYLGENRFFDRATSQFVELQPNGRPVFRQGPEATTDIPGGKAFTYWLRNSDEYLATLEFNPFGALPRITIHRVN